ncbi:hypothetical protein GCM10029963_78080 [Micromonospora andamanensis]
MDSEISEFQRRASAAVMAAIQAAGQIAQLLIDARIAELQRAARASEDRARRARAQARAAQQADAAVWRQAIRTSWWRRASADDIARAWRASATWSAVDPRAREAQRVMTDRLAARGVHVDPKTDMQPENADWLADQLDQAAVESTDPAPDAAQSAATTREPRRTARQRQEEMADYVRQVWSPDRAERVIHSEAWPALAYKLDQLARAGHDVPDLLRQVPGFIDRAHTPAAYAFRAVDDYATDQAAAGERAAAAKEHPSVTLDGEWSEASGTVPGATAAYANTDSAIGGAIEPDVRAAQLAGRAFPRRPDLWSRTLRLRSLQRQGAAATGTASRTISAHSRSQSIVAGRCLVQLFTPAAKAQPRCTSSSSSHCAPTIRWPWRQPPHGSRSSKTEPAGASGRGRTCAQPHARTRPSRSQILLGDGALSAGQGVAGTTPLPRRPQHAENNARTACRRRCCAAVQFARRSESTRGSLPPTSAVEALRQGGRR